MIVVKHFVHLQRWAVQVLRSFQKKIPLRYQRSGGCKRSHERQMAGAASRCRSQCGMDSTCRCSPAEWALDDIPKYPTGWETEWIQCHRFSINVVLWVDYLHMGPNNRCFESLKHHPLVFACVPILSQFLYIYHWIIMVTLGYHQVGGRGMDWPALWGVLCIGRSHVERIPAWCLDGCVDQFPHGKP